MLQGSHLHDAGDGLVELLPERQLLQRGRSRYSDDGLVEVAHEL